MLIIRRLQTTSVIVFVAYFGAFIATRLISSWIYGEEVWKRYKHASLKVVLCVGCFQNILYCFSIVLNPLNLLPLMALSCSCGGLLGGLIIIASPLHALLLSTAPPVVICFVWFFAQNRPVVSNCHGHFALNANPCHIREQPFSD